MPKSQLFGSADLSLSNGWQTHCPKTNLNKYFKTLKASLLPLVLMKRNMSSF